MLPPCIMLIYSTHTGQPRVISRNLDRPLSCSEVPVRPVIRLFPHFAPPPAVGSGPANRANAAHMHLRVHTSAKQKHEYPSYDPAGPLNGNAKKGHARCPPICIGPRKHIVGESEKRRSRTLVLWVPCSDGFRCGCRGNKRRVHYPTHLTMAPYVEAAVWLLQSTSLSSWARSFGRELPSHQHALPLDANTNGYR